MRIVPSVLVRRLSASTLFLDTVERERERERGTERQEGKRKKEKHWVLPHKHHHPLQHSGS